ncbi:lasso RiPP family leader peptide-containing protein [Nocardiopsis sp. RSe5-2]|uniref:Lasso RiPP family leader peptide-containing protein n=1 Tax=Nocardiopsis endophytica TaxID=3018445 RepID=A0ABT4TXU3_9ACTN|nr:lasso RiPP family leader peptide-containing protein [Nocardiopsis endophytica]MDA2809075.1 lasso RiPP family leader peptide-containing protein [Nocardiopsis endophytica]
MPEYTAPALTHLGDFRRATLGYGPLSIWDGTSLGISP